MNIGHSQQTKSSDNPSTHPEVQLQTQPEASSGQEAGVIRRIFNRFISTAAAEHANHYLQRAYSFLTGQDIQFIPASSMSERELNCGTRASLTTRVTYLSDTPVLSSDARESAETQSLAEAETKPLAEAETTPWAETEEIPESKNHPEHQETAATPVSTSESATAEIDLTGVEYINEPSPDVCQAYFEHLLDEFLNIHPDEHLLPGGDIRSNYLPGMNTARTLDQEEVLLFQAVLEWQQSKDREAVKPLFQEAQTFSLQVGGYSVIAYLELWRLMHHYKMLLEGDQTVDKAYLISHLLEPADRTPADLVILKALFCFGCLPGLEGFENYETGIDVLLELQLLQEKKMIASPVSFTEFDHLRFCYFNESIFRSLFQRIKAMDSNTKNFILFIILKSIAHLPLSEQHPVLKMAAEVAEISIPSYLRLHKIIRKSTAPIIAAKNNNPVDPKEIKDVNARNQHILQTFSSTNNEQIFSFFHFITATLTLLSPTQGSRVKYGTAARSFAESAQFSPRHWYQAYTNYLRAGLTIAAIDAAQHLSRFLQNHNPALAEYWNDTALELQSSLSKAERKKQAAGQAPTSAPAEDTYDAEAIAAAIEQAFPSTADSEKTARSRKGKSKSSGKKGKGKARTSEKTDPAQTAQRETPQTVTQAIPSARAQPSSKEAIKRPVVGVSRRANNRPDISALTESDWQVKSQVSSIQPNQRLCSEHWNSKIHNALKRIKDARKSSDKKTEMDVYKNLFNDSKNKVLIGIERIWEEYAWTQLHQVDHFFTLGHIGHSDRTEALALANSAREYLLPALAHLLGLEQMNTDIHPREIWDRAQTLLQQPEYANPAINTEFRFRLRCIFSSMGHTYSLSAMADPAHSRKLGELARTWFGFKTIDPNYQKTTV